MRVKEIIKLACVFLENNELLSTNLFDGVVVPTSDNIYEHDLLLSMVNQVNSIISSEYIKLFKTNHVVSEDGKINFSEISGNNKLLNIVSVKDEYGNSVVYKVVDGYLKTVAGKLLITYTYNPDNVQANDNINDYKTLINERVFAYGVVSEYCFVKSLYTDASMWDSRFKNSMLAITSRRGEVKIKKRRWI